MVIERFSALRNAVSMHRIILLYGIGIQDRFITEDFRNIGINEALWEEFRSLGFERIVFMNGQSQVYFLDEKSKKLSKPSSNSPIKSPSSLSNNLMFLDGGPLGKINLLASQNRPASQEQNFSNQSVMDDIFAIKILDHLMHDEDGPKTVIIFDQAINTIRDFNDGRIRQLAVRVSKWFRASKNKNVAVFLFGLDESEQVSNSIQRLDISEFQYFIRGERRDKGLFSIIRIPEPDLAEIGRTIECARLQYGLYANWQQMGLFPKTLLAEAFPVNFILRNLELGMTLTREDLLRFCSQMISEKPALQQLMDMIGLKEMKAHINQFITDLEYAKEYDDLDTFNRSNEFLHMVFSGNPGTGKTTVAKLIGEIFRDLNLLKRGHLVQANMSDLIGQYVGTTAHRVNSLVDRAIDGVLFIDEAYQLADKERGAFGQEAIESLMQRASEDKHHLVIVMAGYPKLMNQLIESNPGMKRRFPNVLNFDDFLPDDLYEIFIRHKEIDPVLVSNEVDASIRSIFAAVYRNRDEQFGNAGFVENFIVQFNKMRRSRIVKDASPRNAPYIVDDIPDNYRDLLPPQKIKIEEILSEVNNLIGLENVKQYILTEADAWQFQKDEDENFNPLNAGDGLHMIFTGNPGTGKTTVARLFGKIFKSLGFLSKGHVIEADRGSMVAEYSGQTAIKTKEIIKSALDGVLFIDEANGLIQSENDGFGRESINALIKEMEDKRDRFLVIIAGYPNEMEDFLSSNSGLEGRFYQKLFFPNYSGEELLKISRMFNKKHGFSFNLDVESKLIEIFENYAVVKGKQFSNARDARIITRKMRTHFMTRNRKMNNKNPEKILTMEDIPSEFLMYLEPKSIDMNVILSDLDKMVGLQAVKELVNKKAAVWVREQKYPVLAREIKPSLHMIFTGNPGTGKTSVARMFGKIYKSLGKLKRGHVVEVQRPDLIGRYVGETALKTKKVIESALDGVLFIDEAYSLASGVENDFGDEAIAVIMKDMEDFRDRLVVIVAGYAYEMEEFKRSNSGLMSRFKEEVIFQDYSDDEILQIAEIIASEFNMELSESVKVEIKYRIGRVRDMRGREFGNGRTVRNTIETMIDNYALRIFQEGIEKDNGVFEVRDIPEIIPY